MDGSDEEQSFKEELKEYIDDKIGDFNADSDFVYAKQEDFEDIHEIILKPIKSAYEYAKDGGYTGTEEEFAAELANYANLGGKVNEHNEASDAHQDIRNLIENIDVSNAINIHNIDESAHQDIRNLISNMAPAHTWSTEDIVAGSASTEPNGTLHLVIE